MDRRQHARRVAHLLHPVHSCLAPAYSSLHAPPYRRPHLRIEAKPNNPAGVTMETEISNPSPRVGRLFSRKPILLASMLVGVLALAACGSALSSGGGSAANLALAPDFEVTLYKGRDKGEGQGGGGTRGRDKGEGQGGGTRGRDKGRDKGEGQGGGTRGRDKGEGQGGGTRGRDKGRDKGEGQGGGTRGRDKGEGQGGGTRGRDKGEGQGGGTRGRDKGEGQGGGTRGRDKGEGQGGGTRGRADGAALGPSG